MTKISSLPALSGVADSADLIPIVDVSDASESALGTTKRATRSQFGVTGIRGDTSSTVVFSSGVAGDAADRFVVTGTELKMLLPVAQAGAGPVFHFGRLNASRMIAYQHSGQQIINVEVYNAANTFLSNLLVLGLETPSLTVNAKTIVAALNAGDVTLQLKQAAAATARTFEVLDSALALRMGVTKEGAIVSNSGAYAGATAAGGTISFGTGAPNNANGSNNDIYFRGDGGAGSTIYQRRAGAWAVVA